MSFTTLKKQMNKADQYLREKLGAADSTKLDEEFVEMEKRCNVTSELLEDISSKTKEFLQPNPGQALVQSGETMKHLADVKYGLEDNLKQNFLDPFKNLQEKEVKEVLHLCKKTYGRRLDYDAKKRKKTPDAELAEAEVKFVESKNQATQAMQYILQNDVEMISELASFADGLLDYHKKCVTSYEDLAKKLHQKKQEASARPRLAQPHFLLAPSNDNNIPASTPIGEGHNSMYPGVMAAPSHSPPTSGAVPQCKALYDFEALNPGELEFKENDVITLTKDVDENWFEGRLGTRTGYFPKTYVTVVVPLSSGHMTSGSRGP